MWSRRGGRGGVFHGSCGLNRPLLQRFATLRGAGGSTVAPLATGVRKVRAPQGRMPANGWSASQAPARASTACGRRRSRRTVPQKPDRLFPASQRREAPGAGGTEVRVKRCGKSAPDSAETRSAGKPHPVQDPTVREGRPAPVTARMVARGARRRVSQRDDRAATRVVDRTRLTAPPHPHKPPASQPLGGRPLFGSLGGLGKRKRVYLCRASSAASTKPAIMSSPPRGVTAPSHRTPDSARA
jgi:hypothetical protein